MTPVARNIEIKARIASVEVLMPLVAAIAENGPTDLFQDDTYFRCLEGRLKLREITSPQAQPVAQLIYYRRPDVTGPKVSHYLISPTSAPDALRESLMHACGQIGRVRKHRVLYLVGRTRIHLDRVEGLGEFLELEVVLEPGEALTKGEAQAHELMERLGVREQHLVSGSYLELQALLTMPRPE